MSILPDLYQRIRKALLANQYFKSEVLHHSYAGLDEKLVDPFDPTKPKNK